MRIFLLIAIVITLAGCGTARTMVLEPVQATSGFTRVVVHANTPTVKVPPDVRETFESALEKGLYESGKFQRGPDLQIDYQFVSYSPGNRFSRWFWGGIGNAGEGSLVIVVRYLNKDGKELAKTQVEGRIGSGFFGGSTDEAITKAAEDVVKFTVDKFSTK